MTKMTETYDYLKSQGKVTALTLYYNTPCQEARRQRDVRVGGRQRSRTHEEQDWIICW